MIKEHLQTAIANIQAEKECVINAAKNKIIEQKIAPYNADVDMKAQNAIAELEQKKNSQISALQVAFENDKKAIMERAEQNKAANAASVIASETAQINAKYDKIIEKLNEELNDIGV